MSDTARAISTSIDNLPELLADAFVLIVSYLAPPERALFAIFDRCCNPEVRQLILSETSWETLDFGLLQEDVASNLTDNELSSILFYIDARHNVKTLKMNGCSGIVGYGLGPLRRSTVIEELELSIVRKGPQGVDLEQDLVLDEQIVVPILSSSLPPAIESSSLFVIHFPQHWRDNKNPVLTAFLRRGSSI